MLKRIQVFELTMVFQAARCDASSFLRFKDEPKGVEMVAKFRSRAEAILLEFDRRMILLCKEDANDRAEWEERMRSIRALFEELDRQLAVQGTESFNWEAVARAMGYINAHRVATEMLLNFNEIKPPE